MDIEKVLTLVAIVVYGLVNIVLSVVRTLKTSKISSEVKSILPPIDDGKPTDVVEQSSADDDDDKQTSGDEVDPLVSSLVDLINKVYRNK